MQILIKARIIALRGDIALETNNLNKAEHREWLVTFGARLRAERTRQKLTRIALANKIGTKQDYIAQIERGDKSPSMSTLRKILQALHISADSLMFGVNDDELKGVSKELSEVTEILKRKTEDEIRAFCDIIKFMSSRVTIK